MTERTRSWIQAAEISFFCRVAGHSFRDRVRSSTIWEELGVAAPPDREESFEVTWASVLNATWTPPLGGVPGTSHLEKAQGKAQDTLEGLCLSAGLGTPRAPPQVLSFSAQYLQGGGVGM
ncbi:hypothetical protein ATANTOWER_000899 [Ataeniobius toweri]|uniref:Uncharacterized protein n=1 Tax=Ataeniobius toweri TaxID=208326 RepID=A0ABU7CEC3_9TELE|nr:hypothetical protein [Ataeniobius toweri]